MYAQEPRMKVAFKGTRNLGHKAKHLLATHFKIVNPCYADIGFSILWTHKIREPELSAPKRGWINLHIGKLPDYGGIYTVHHALWNGDTNFGVTLHEMDNNFDTGPIIEVKEFTMTSRDPDLVYDQAFEVAWDLFVRRLPSLITGSYKTKPNRGGHYYNGLQYRKRRMRNV